MKRTNTHTGFVSLGVALIFLSFTEVRSPIQLLFMSNIVPHIIKFFIIKCKLLSKDLILMALGICSWPREISTLEINDRKTYGVLQPIFIVISNILYRGQKCKVKGYLMIRRCKNICAFSYFPQVF